MANTYQLAVIGGGPAGMMAAISAGIISSNLCLLERNASLGKKLLLTGKERCNFTTANSIREMVEAFGLPKGKFLMSALTQFSNEDLINFFQSRGVAYVIERGNRIFPKDGRAISILNTLETEIARNKTPIILNFRVVKIAKKQTHFRIISDQGEVILSQKVIIATGGKTYPSTGSTGDGYALAKSLGHKVNPLKPALVPLVVKDPNIRNLAGLSLKNVKLSILVNEGQLLEIFGEMLFTHFGLSGPIVLTISKKVGELIERKKKISVSIDLKPALDKQKLQKRIQREMETIGKKEYKTLLEELLPQSLIPLTISRTQIDQHRKIGSLTKGEKSRLVDFLKDFSFKIDSTLPIERGIITSGGIEINEINSKTMESKIVPGLYFAGEIIGIDGPTGGYNLQKAFSTGYVAGKSAVMYLTSSSLSKM